MNKLRRLATGRNPSLGVMPPLIELQVPVLQQLTAKTLLGEDRPIVGFKISPFLEVFKMRTDTAERSGAARDLNHHFRYTPSRATGMRDLSRAERTPLTGSSTSIGGDVEEGNL